VDLLTGSRGSNLYTLSLGDMMESSPICILSKSLKTKSWLWHRRLSHLNFSTINHLARHDLDRGHPKLKFKKDQLCYAYVMAKSNKKPHKPKSKNTNQEKLYLLHMDLCGPMRVASVNEKKYILVIFYDYSRFTLVGIPLETSVAPPPQQNGVVERGNRTLIEASRTIADLPTPKFIAPIAEVVAPVLVAPTGSHSLTTVDQDAPSPSNSQTLPETQSPIISNYVEEENHKLAIAHMNNDLFFGAVDPTLFIWKARNDLLLSFRHCWGVTDWIFVCGVSLLLAFACSRFGALVMSVIEMFRIPLLDGKVLRVLGERPEEKVIHLMSAKAKEQKQEEMVVVRDFPKGEEQELAFQTLKDKLYNAHVLALPDGLEDFVVYFDASEIGLGCVLMKRVSSIWIIRVFNIFLVKLNMRRHHWIELFSDYDYEIRYRPGKANVVDDALSRKERVKPKRVRALNMTLQSSIKDRILSA
nr:reverse transcriptase domain-containing protein [Tanacetum cinerariifolium]